MKRIFKLIKKILFFFQKYIAYNPQYVFFYAVAYLLPRFSFQPNFLKKNEIIQQLQHKSFLRIGDGEVHIMLGQGIGFQKKDDRLAEYLRKSISSYSPTSPYILGINELVMSKKNTYLRQKGALRLWLPMKIFYYLYFPKNMPYADASMFYYKDSFLFYLKDTIKNKEIILVSRKENIENFISHSKNNTIHAVITKDTDSFDDFDSLVSKIDSIASHFGYENCIVLAACGPASKALVYEMSSRLQVFDIGVGLEIAFTGKTLENIIAL